MRRVLGVAAAALVLGSWGAQAGTPAFNPANAARGKTLAEPCAACHFIEGMQAGALGFQVPKLAGQRPEAIFQALRDYKSGARKSELMAPMVANLTEQNMRDLGAYLSAGGPHMPATAGADTWAHDKVHRDCTHCHGESGMGVMPGVPVLTGQHADYLVHALESYRNGDRSNPTMGPVVAKLTPKEIKLLAEYFALQKHLKVSQ
jgi:cytochrome c553